MVQKGTFDIKSVGLIPVSMISGIALGIIGGFSLYFLFKHIKLSNPVKVLLTFSITLLMVGLETLIKDYFSISSLLGVMTVGIIIFFKDKKSAESLRKGYSRMWVFFEILLFVLVGATVNINYLGNVGAKAIIVIVGALVFRMIGVFVCLIKTQFNSKERLFWGLFYIKLFKHT